MITYAIITNSQDEPVGYLTTDHTPSLEELADHVAIAEGYPTRDDWIIDNRIDEIAFAPVH
ncbi:beta-lactoglobulin I [Burkholderia ambifaria]|uniref:beta-lactoglobulin I n=1 Tax=Burkholderia ambifaria TaxID=152480 RepID=UPI00158999B5|nr:beta-lactoglobulin I [Burkholderia ambifaria]